MVWVSPQSARGSIFHRHQQVTQHKARNRVLEKDICVTTLKKYIQPRRYTRHLSGLSVCVEDVNESLALAAPTVESQLENRRRQELKLSIARDAALRKLAQSPKRILMWNLHRIEAQLAQVRGDNLEKPNSEPK